MLGHSRGLYFSSITAPTQVSQASAVTASPTVPAAPVEEPITIGNEMVILFFVLSGYLVGGSVLSSLRRRTWSWSTYLIKRLSRLWIVLLPALLLGLALDLVGVHFFGGAGSIYDGPLQQAIVDQSVQARMHWTLLWGNMAFLQGIFVPLLGTNDSLWSLANEFWYYIAFPAMLVPFTKGIAPVTRWLGTVVFLIVAFTVGPAIGGLFPIWILGALLSLAPRSLPRRPAVAGSTVLALLLPVACVLMVKLHLPRWQAQYLIAAYSTALLWLLLQQCSPARPGLYQQVSSFFSHLSYSLYLFHLPILVFFTAVVNRPWRVLSHSPANLARFAMVNLATVIVAELLYRLFEAHTDQVRDFFLRRHQESVQPPLTPNVYALDESRLSPVEKT
jgi:peptidoglycan/LPS O-acetylase OafA/YrhL